MTTIAVRVPEADRTDLQRLLDELESDAEAAVAHPFDGETVVQAVILLSAGGFPFFRAWVNSRTTQRKQFSIVHDGTELKGYTAAEAGQILMTVASTIPDLDPAEARATDEKPDPSSAD